MAEYHGSKPPSSNPDEILWALGELAAKFRMPLHAVVGLASRSPKILAFMAAQSGMKPPTASKESAERAVARSLPPPEKKRTLLDEAVKARALGSIAEDVAVGVPDVPILAREAATKDDEVPREAGAAAEPTGGPSFVERAWERVKKPPWPWESSDEPSDIGGGAPPPPGSVPATDPLDEVLKQANLGTPIPALEPPTSESGEPGES